MRFKRSTTLLVVLAAALSLSGCHKAPAETVPSETAPLPAESLTVLSNQIESTADILEINDMDVTLAVGDRTVLTAHYTGTGQLLWSSPDLDVVSVSPNGEVIAFAPGTASVIVTDGKISAGIVFPVAGNEAEETTEASEENQNAPEETAEERSEETASSATDPDTSGATLRISSGDFSLGIGQTKTLRYSYSGSKSLRWTSSNPSVATVSANGTVTGVKAGTASITLRDDSLSAKVTVTVSPQSADNSAESTTAPESLRIESANFSLEVGQSKAVTYSYTGSKNLSWRSSNSSVAAVSDGTISAKSAGSATITVSDGTLSSQVTVTVAKKPSTSTPTAPSAKLEISQRKITLRVGETANLSYTYTGTEQVRYEVEFEHVANVDQSGNITAYSLGTAYIYVTDGKVEKCCTVCVVDTPPVTRIDFDGETGPLSGTYYVGNTLKFWATAYPNEANVRATVTSSNWKIANVTNYFDGRYNRITCNFVGEGPVTITVTSDDGAVSRSVSLDVTTYVPDIPSNELTTDQFAQALMDAMFASGWEKLESQGGWRMLTVRDGQLTSSFAYSVGNSIVREMYPNGSRYGSCRYSHQDEDGNYIFYIEFG